MTKIGVERCGFTEPDISVKQVRISRQIYDRPGAKKRVIVVTPTLLHISPYDQVDDCMESNVHYLYDPLVFICIYVCCILHIFYMSIALESMNLGLSLFSASLFSSGEVWAKFEAARNLGLLGEVICGV